MKRSVKIIALAMCALMICLSLVSCGNKLSGEYENKSILGKSTYEFKGNKFTYSYGELEIEGTYKIKDDKITFEFDIEDEDQKELADALFDNSCDFEKTEDGIEINGIEYKKVD
jgi:uncharacterized lipoprotein YehR (DUF1307 family)